MTRPRWEYEIARTPFSRDQMNAVGADGWELAAATASALIFKRPIEDDATEDPDERRRRARSQLQELRAG